MENTPSRSSTRGESLAESNRVVRITTILRAHRQGDETALSTLFGIVYAELRRMSRRRLAAEGNQSLDSTALVHELFLKLADQGPKHWENRQHFFAVAAQAMRHIVVDYARRRTAQKRGGDAPGDVVVPSEGVGRPDALELLALDQALSRLESADSRLAQIVQLRFFAGFSVDDTAEVLAVDPRTIRRNWRKARAFLRCQLRGHSYVEVGEA